MHHYRGTCYIHGTDTCSPARGVTEGLRKKKRNRIVPNTTARSRRGSFALKMCTVLRKITKSLILILVKDQSLNLFDSGN